MEPLATRLAALLRAGENTRLSSAEEVNYQMWRLQHNVPESNDYNMRGFYKSQSLAGAKAAGLNANDGQMHYPDTFKLPNHATFSTDSGYYDPTTMPQTPTWEGGRIGNTGAESWTLRRPNGAVVASEAPWLKKMMKGE